MLIRNFSWPAGRLAGRPAGRPAKTENKANLSPAWISLAWAELGNIGSERVNMGGVEIMTVGEGVGAKVLVYVSNLRVLGCFLLLSQKNVMVSLGDPSPRFLPPKITQNLGRKLPLDANWGQKSPNMMTK